MLSIMEIQLCNISTSFPLESRCCTCLNRFHSPKHMNIQLQPVGWDTITPTPPTTINGKCRNLHIYYNTLCNTSHTSKVVHQMMQPEYFYPTNIVIHRHSKKRESTPPVDNSLRHQLSNIKELVFLNGILFVFLMTCKLKHILIMQGNHANGST